MWLHASPVLAQQPSNGAPCATCGASAPSLLLPASLTPVAGAGALANQDPSGCEAPPSLSAPSAIGAPAAVSVSAQDQDEASKLEATLVRVGLRAALADTAWHKQATRLYSSGVVQQLERLARGETRDAQSVVLGKYVVVPGRLEAGYGATRAFPSIVSLEQFGSDVRASVAVFVRAGEALKQAVVKRAAPEATARLRAPIEAELRRMRDELGVDTAELAGLYRQLQALGTAESRCREQSIRRWERAYTTGRWVVGVAGAALVTAGVATGVGAPVALAIGVHAGLLALATQIPPSAPRARRESGGERLTPLVLATQSRAPRALPPQARDSTDSRAPTSAKKSKNTPPGKDQDAPWRDPDDADAASAEALPPLPKLPPPDPVLEQALAEAAKPLPKREFASREDVQRRFEALLKQLPRTKAELPPQTPASSWEVDLLLDAEALGNDSELTYQQRLKAKAGIEQVSGMIQAVAGRLSNDPDAFAASIRDVMRKFSGDYYRDSASLLDRFSELGANCQAMTKIALAAIARSGVKIPDGQVLAFQMFSDHVEPVLFDVKTQQIRALHNPKLSADRPSAPVLRPEAILVQLARQGGARVDEAELTRLRDAYLLARRDPNTPLLKSKSDVDEVRQNLDLNWLEAGPASAASEEPVPEFADAGGGGGSLLTSQDRPFYKARAANAQELTHWPSWRSYQDGDEGVFSDEVVIRSPVALGVDPAVFNRMPSRRQKAMLKQLAKEETANALRSPGIQRALRALTSFESLLGVRPEDARELMYLPAPTGEKANRADFAYSATYGAKPDDSPQQRAFSAAQDRLIMLKRSLRGQVPTDPESRRRTDQDQSDAMASTVIALERRAASAEQMVAALSVLRYPDPRGWSSRIQEYEDLGSLAAYILGKPQFFGVRPQRQNTDGARERKSAPSSKKAPAKSRARSGIEFAQETKLKSSPETYVALLAQSDLSQCGEKGWQGAVNCPLLQMWRPEYLRYFDQRLDRYELALSLVSRLFSDQVSRAARHRFDSGLGAGEPRVRAEFTIRGERNVVVVPQAWGGLLEWVSRVALGSQGDGPRWRVLGPAPIEAAGVGSEKPETRMETIEDRPRLTPGAFFPGSKFRPR